MASMPVTCADAADAIDALVAILESVREQGYVSRLDEKHIDAALAPARKGGKR